MAVILRLPAIAVLLALVLLSAAGALAAAGLIAGVETGVAQVEAAQAAAAEAGATDATWISVGLLAASAVFFLISAIRLMRRTQAFWTWLLGFACYGGHWAYNQYLQGVDVVAQVQGLNLNTYMQPQTLLEDLTAPESQIALLGIILVVGLFVFIVDAVDRAHWDREAG